MKIKDAIAACEIDDEKPVNAFGVYQPYHQGQNPKFDDFSREVLKVKNMEDWIIKEVSLALDARFNEGFMIAVVPSHDPEKHTSGIRMIAEFLCRDGKRGNATKCLVRHTKVAKMASGGNRQVQVHRNSIKVENPALIKDKLVILLDDVTTTNNSLFACRDILLKSGAKSVFPFALAQTASNQ